MPAHKIYTPPRTCQQCGAVYERLAGTSSGQFSKSQFCSRSCLTAHRHATGRAQLVEDVEWLLGTDSITSIASRLGYDNPLSLHRQLERLGRWDLARHFDKVSAA